MIDLILNFVVILETMEHGFWCGVYKYMEMYFRIMLDFVNRVVNACSQLFYFCLVTKECIALLELLLYKQVPEPTEVTILATEFNL